MFSATRLIMYFIAVVFVLALAGRSCAGQSCSSPRGISSGRLIPTSVSHAQVDKGSHTFIYSARHAQLHRTRLPDCWATTVNRYGLQQQYIQVVLPQLTRLTAIETQGCPSLQCWTKTYIIQYSAVSSMGPFVTIRKDDLTKIMVGNKDPWRVTRNQFRRPIPAVAIRLIPKKFHSLRCLRMELYGCSWTQGAADPIGLGDGRVHDNQISASSYWPGAYSNSIEWSPTNLLLPSYARLHHVSSSTGAGWCAYSSGKNESLQVDLLSPHTITAISTQGVLFHGLRLYVDSFHVTCSTDGRTFHLLTTNHGSTKFIRGRRIHKVAVHRVSPPRTCRWVTLTHFTTPFEHIPPCLRLELYGCSASSGCINMASNNIGSLTHTGQLPTVGAPTLSAASNSFESTRHATKPLQPLTPGFDDAMKSVSNSNAATAWKDHMSKNTRAATSTSSFPGGKHLTNSQTRAIQGGERTSQDTDIDSRTQTSSSPASPMRTTRLPLHEDFPTTAASALNIIPTTLSTATSNSKVVPKTTGVSNSNSDQQTLTQQSNLPAVSHQQSLTQQGTTASNEDTTMDISSKPGVVALHKLHKDTLGRGDKPSIKTTTEHVHTDEGIGEGSVGNNHMPTPTLPQMRPSNSSVLAETAAAKKSREHKGEQGVLHIIVPVVLAVGLIIFLIALVTLLYRREKMKRLAKETPYQHVVDPGPLWSSGQKETPDNSRTDIYAVPTTMQNHHREADSVLYESASRRSPRNSSPATSHSNTPTPGSVQTSSSRRGDVPLQRTLATVQPDTSSRQQFHQGDERTADGRRDQSFASTMDGEEEERYVSHPMMFPDPRSPGDAFENLHDIVN